MLLNVTLQIEAPDNMPKDRAISVAKAAVAAGIAALTRDDDFDVAFINLNVLDTPRYEPQYNNAEAPKSVSP